MKRVTTLSLTALLALPLAGTAQAASRMPAVATDGMVVTESPPASWVGARILRQGGNAVDAAIAVHFALAVTHPEAGNLGGGGFLLLRMADGTQEAIDFREIAPGTATRELFLDSEGRPDPRLSTATLYGTGVPGAVAGMGLAHERHGTLPWKTLLEPAIRLARDGFVVDRYLSMKLRAFEGRLGRHAESRRIFLRDGDFYAEGDTLRQPELAATLARIAHGGPREFYEGATADSLLAEMERGGGLIVATDLRDYRAKVRAPLTGNYRGRTILAMPPPSSGGVAVIQMLGMLEGFPLGRWGPLSSQALHVTTEAMKHAFADRAEFLGDPDFTPIPVTGLIDRGYIDSLAQGIDLARAVPSLTAGPGRPAGHGDFYEATGGSPGADLLVPVGSEGPGGQETTHFNVIDERGNAVAVTTTLNTSFGTGIMVTGAGFLLNNELDDFAAAPGVPNYYGLIQGEANAVRPFARPLSSMTPALVLEEDHVVLALGSPGGPRIITAVLQTLLNVVDHGMHIREAIDAPRVHHQWWPDTLYAEPRALVADVREALRLRGQPLSGMRQIGSVQGVQVLVRDDGDVLLGAADPRRNGCAVGVSDGRLVSDCPCALGP
jgi:gamma-glutamyltranspeptidase/glutathione hydrolase